MKKRKKITDEQVRASLGAEFYERHERVQRELRTVSEALKRQAAERRRASGTT